MGIQFFKGTQRGYEYNKLKSSYVVSCCLYIGFSVVHIDSWGCFCGNLVLVTIFFVFVEDSL